MRTLVRPATALALAAAFSLLPGAAVAQTAAGNDHFDGATVITSLPYPGSPDPQPVDTTGATGDPADPICWEPAGGYSVWYTLTAPESGTLRVGASATREDFENPGLFRPIDTGVAVLFGAADASGPGDLVGQACDLIAPFEDGHLDVAVTAGQQVWVMAGGRSPDSTATQLSLSIRYLPQVTVAVDPHATVDANGAATLQVTTSCVRAESATLHMVVMQGGGRPFGGITTVTVPCSPQPTSTSIEVVGQGRSFHPGPASYEVTASAGEFDPVTATASGSLLLRRS